MFNDTKETILVSACLLGQLREGNGITVQYLQSMGIQVYHEGEVELLLGGN